MSLWTCGINECRKRFEDVETAIIHQTVDHGRHQCTVCGSVVPDGYFAIRHAFEEHSRAEYVRAYDADSSAVRTREDVKRAIEEEANLRAVVEELKQRDAI
jgi:hypothetical protein